MSVPWELRLTRHEDDLNDDGHDAIENLVTVETDTTLVAAPDGAGGVEFRAEAGGSGLFVTVIEGGQDTIKAHGNTGSTETFDPTDGNVHTATLNANCTFTLNAPVGSGAATLELYLTQDGTGSRTVTWPGSVVWPGGITPTLSTAAASVDRIVLETLDGGTTWYGVMVGSGGGTGSALTVKDEGSNLDTAVTSLDFVGAGVVATNTSHAVTVTVPGQTFATPAIVLGTAGSAGAATTGVRSDSTIAAFDATVPVTQAFGDTAATGSAAKAARRDHVHGMPASPTSSVVANAHAHVVSENHLSNGSATTYTLDQAFEAGSVIAWNTTTLARLGVTETQPDRATVSAAGSSGDTIMFDYAATVV